MQVTDRMIDAAIAAVWPLSHSPIEMQKQRASMRKALIAAMEAAEPEEEDVKDQS